MKKWFTLLKAKTPRFKTGFTLIELLVVMAIIGVIATFAVIAFNRMRADARDTQRLSDIKQLGTALELYRADEGNYPTAITPGQSLVGPTSGITYFQRVPTNPIPTDDGTCTVNEYEYISVDNGASFQITYCLGQTISGVTAGVNLSKPYIIAESAPVAPPACEPDCTGKCAGESDGCDGTCTCSNNLVCASGTCCTPTCSTKGANSGCGFTCSNDVIDSGTATFPGVYDSVNQKVVKFFACKANVATLTTASVSYGADATVSACTNLRGAFDSGNGKVVAVFNSTNNSNYGYARVGTVSGTDISFGTPAVVNATANKPVSAGYDSANGKIVVAYGTGSGGAAKVGTVSGTDISFGTAAAFSAVDVGNLGVTYDVAHGKIVIVYDNGSNVYAVVGTVSGTDISFGSPATIVSNDYAMISDAFYDSLNQKVLAVWRNWGYGRNRVAVGTVSGTDISFGTIVNASTGTTQNAVSFAFDDYAGKLIMAYGKAANTGAAVVVGTVSGTDITFSAAKVFMSSGSLNSMGIVYDGNSHKTLISYYNAQGLSLVISLLSGEMAFY